MTPPASDDPYAGQVWDDLAEIMRLEASAGADNGVRIIAIGANAGKIANDYMALMIGRGTPSDLLGSIVYLIASAFIAMRDYCPDVRDQFEIRLKELRVMFENGA